MEKFKSNKGITLIALVITIIVLLILIGVSVSTITGETGILAQSVNSREKTAEAQTTEDIELAVQGAIIRGTGSLKKDNLTKELDNKFGTGKYKITDSENGWTVIVDGLEYEIVENGKVALKGNVSDIPEDSTDDDKEIAYALVLDNSISDSNYQPLIFVREDEEINAGDIYKSETYGDLTVVASYTGFETDRYIVGGGKMRAAAAYYATTPWFDYAYDITSVVFEDTIRPQATAAWFYAFTSCYYMDLTKLDMSNTDDMSYMFTMSDISNIPTLTLSANMRCMNYAFQGCSSLNNISGFIIPDGVTEIMGIFNDCTLITDFSNLIVPSSVTDMTMAFSYCTSMTSGPDLTNATNVISMGQAFLGCESLTVAPIIPSAQYAGQLFEDCTALTTAPILPSNLISGYNIFSDCTNLKTYSGSTEEDGIFLNYIIPDNVEDLSSAFYGCTLITTAPNLEKCTALESVSSMFRDCSALINPPQKLPNSVTDMSMMFYCCEKMTTAPDLSGCTNLTNMDYAFSVCRKLTSIPIIPSSVTSVKETFDICSSANTYHGNNDSVGDFSNYVIPSGVTSLYGTFSGTKMVIAPIVHENILNLTTAFENIDTLTSITINSTPTTYSYCFRWTDMSKVTIHGTCDATLKQTIANTGKNGTSVTIAD